jgi:hypothetical protein
VAPLTVRDVWAMVVLMAAGLALAIVAIAVCPGVILGPHHLRRA